MRRAACAVLVLASLGCASPGQLVLGSKDQGCTASPDIAGGGPCRKHDWAYFVGGTRQDRFIADAELLFDLALEDVPPEVAEFYYVGVRALGWTRWRYTEHRSRRRPARIR